MFVMDSAIPQRLDRLPVSRELWRVLALAGLAWLIESYDIGVIGTILRTLKSTFGLDSAGQGLVAITSTPGTVASVIPPGSFADQLGRERMLMIGTAWYAIFTSLTALIVLVSIPGKFTGARAVERLGRKATILVFGIISALNAVLFGFAQATIMIFGGMLLSFFGIGIDPALKIYGAGQYRTYTRETSVGFIKGIGRLFGGALAPFFMSLALAGGVAGSYLLVAGAAMVSVVAVAMLGTEMSGRSLERVSTFGVSTVSPARIVS